VQNFETFILIRSCNVWIGVGQVTSDFDRAAAVERGHVSGAADLSLAFGAGLDLPERRAKVHLCANAPHAGIGAPH
jgi:hypothetical protein